MFFVLVLLVGLQLNSGTQVICPYFSILLLFLFLLIILRLIRRLYTRKSLFLNADTAHEVQENLI